MIAALLAAERLAASEIRRIAVTLGPGTFTGVRTGIAAARGLALAAGAEIVGTTSLAVIAAGLAADDAASVGIAVAVDARKGDVFLQRFDAAAAPLAEPVLLPLGQAALTLAGSTWRIAGSAAEPLADAARGHGATIAATYPEREPDAAVLVGLAGSLAPLTVARPLYLRLPDAVAQTGRSLPTAMP
jgi:tRNA threonylcarbamoyl adenosine modification protein YeaZ